jgi:hypothetical protein
VSAHTQLLQQASVEQTLSSASLNGGGVFGNSLSFDGPSASYTNELAGGYLCAVCELMVVALATMLKYWRLRRKLSISVLEIL